MPATGRVRRRAYGVAAVCVVLLAAVYLFAVWTATGQRLEDGVLAAAGQGDGAASGHGSWVLDSAALVLSGFVTVAVILVGLLRRRVFLGIVSAGMVGASILTTELLKWVAQRPVLLNTGRRRDDQSFPSGHTVVATSVMCALVLVTPYLLRGLVALLASVWATSVAVATIAAGWHRPSDTVGSNLIVVIYACAAVAVLARRGWVTSAEPTPTAQPWRRYAMMALAAGCAAVVGLGEGGSVTAGGTQLIVARLIASLGSALVALILLALLYRVTLDPPRRGAAT